MSKKKINETGRKPSISITLSKESLKFAMDKSMQECRSVSGYIETLIRKEMEADATR